MTHGMKFTPGTRTSENSALTGRPRVSQRAERVAPFLAMDVLAAAVAKEARGEGVVHLEVGQPAAPAPAVAREAAQKALVDGRIGYTEALGLRALRERIARYYKETHGLSLAPERVVVTTGSSAGFVLAFLSLFEVGDKVAISAPGYPAYRSILDALGIDPVYVPLRAEDRWVMTPEGITAAAHGMSLHGVLAMSPANPSGTMMDATRLGAIAELCRERGLWFISDEIYHGLTYEAGAVSALSVHDDAIIINSFSKYYCMTGWRIGWMVVPERLVRPMERLAQNLYISPPYLSQIAALAAFDGQEEFERVKHGYAANRAMLLEELPKLGIVRMHPADGAFYIYADVAKFTNDSVAFCKRMLDEAGVAITPGLDFDTHEGAHHIRLSFARSFDECREAVRRLKGWLKA